MINANTSALHRAQSPELLIQAHNERFSGRLTISGNAQQLELYFLHGELRALGTPEFLEHSSVELAKELPPEQIHLASRHAERHATDPLSAVEVLGLLPPRVVEPMRLAGLRKAAARLSLGPGRIQAAFTESPSPARSGFPPCLSNSILLITESIEASRHLDWCRERIADSLNTPLLLTEDGRALTLRERPDLQAVVTRLKEKRETLASLRRLDLLSEDALSALIYALRCTGLSSPTLRKERRQSSRPPSDALRKRARSSMRPSPPTPSSSRSGVREIQLTTPSIPDSPPVPAASASRTRATSPPQAQGTTLRPPGDIDVHELESRVLAAWMRANEEERWREKALRLAEAASRRVPGNAQVLYYYGSLLAQSELPGQAQAALRRVLQLDPEHSEAARELARLEFREREKGETSTLLNRWVSRRGSR